MSERLKRQMIAGLIACGIFCVCEAIAGAQAIRLSKLTAKPNLVCVLCSLTVSASPSSVSFTLVPGGTAMGSNSIAITTTMTGVTLLGSLNLYGYFSSAAGALTDGNSTPDLIPSSAVLGLMPTGSPTTYKPFTQSGMLGTPGATLLLYTTPSLSTSGCMPALASCRTDSLSLEINLSGLPQLPAGTYTGTLILQAEAL